MAKKMEVFRRTGFDKPLAMACLFLLTFGLIMVFSTSAVLSADRFDRPFHFFLNQLLGALVGLLVVVAVMNTPTPFYQNGIIIHGLMALTVLLLAVALIMPAVGSTNRWIIFMGFRFQPSELAKLSLIISLIISTRKKSGSTSSAFWLHCWRFWVWSCFSSSRSPITAPRC
jgi:cell division protein FtsW